jgi:hypothetical protein
VLGLDRLEVARAMAAGRGRGATGSLEPSPANAAAAAAGSAAADSPAPAARRSSRAIAEALGLPLATVGAELRRLGLNRLPPREPPPPVHRYERARPGELVHVDTKKLGRFWRPGHRIPGSRHHRNPGAGWEVLSVAIDDATRLLYAEVLADETRGDRRGLLPASAGVVCPPRDPGGTVDDGQRQPVCEPAGAGPPGQLARSAPADPAVYPAHEREGRAGDPDAAAWLGLRAALRHLRGPPSRLGELPAIPQHGAETHGHETTDSTRPAGSTQ